MAKNKRKRKVKEQDFQKVKLKVGKKLQPAQNATDTSFKSRSVFIPTQLNKELEPTNQRNQTLKVTDFRKWRAFNISQFNCKAHLQIFVGSVLYKNIKTPSISVMQVSMFKRRVGGGGYGQRCGF